MTVLIIQIFWVCFFQKKEKKTIKENKRNKKTGQKDCSKKEIYIFMEHLHENNNISDLNIIK